MKILNFILPIITLISVTTDKSIASDKCWEDSIRTKKEFSCIETIESYPVMQLIECLKPEEIEEVSQKLCEGKDVSIKHFFCLENFLIMIKDLSPEKKERISDLCDVNKR